MKSILMSVIILISISSVLSAQNILQDNIELRNPPKNFTNDDFEVELSVNKHFKTFVIMGAQISEFLSGFNLSDLGLGIGANVQLNDSLSCYAKYTSASIEDEKLSPIESSAMYVGLAYSF